MHAQKLERHCWFDGWRGTEGPTLHELATEIIAAIDQHFRPTVMEL